MPSKLVLVLFFTLCSAFATAQDIYKSQDKVGPVFSDQPLPGAKSVDLPPLNTYKVPSTSTAPQAKPPVAAPRPYDLLAIAVPENEGTIHTNTGDFDMQLRIEPPLNTTRGDVILVKLDGNLLAQRYFSAKIHIGAADWSQAFGESAEHSLQIAITNQNGTVLIESAPVKFFMHHATSR